MKTVQEMERAIIRKLVEDALRNGYTVKLNDGDRMVATVYALTPEDIEEQTQTLMQDIQATDEEYLIFYVGESRIGYVFLVYGNDGHDVIADCTDTTEMRELLKGAEALAESLYDER